ncbi:MAG: response regulator [Balneolaceae bacterium]|nr:response regulator [Balneolaceae bacterium]
MSKKILLIEDDESIAKYIKHRLEKKGLMVLHKDNGIDGLETIKSEKPDLVVMDMMMPGIDGREVVETVKEKNIIPTDRIIILSGKEVTEEVEALYKLGIQDYLRKPINIEHLMIRIDRILEQLQDKDQS